jgi:hypothetical protein
MENNTDKIVQDLIKVIQNKKSAIAKAEKPNWLTNCSFRYDKGSASVINLQVCSDVVELTEILAFLYQKQESQKMANEMLGLTTPFKWLGYTFDEWFSDIKTRLDKIQIVTKRKELEVLENRLDKLISPELKAQLELAEIQKLLTDND